MPHDRVVERGAQARSLAVVAGERGVRLGEVRGKAGGLRRRPPILRWHGQSFERGLRALAAAHGHLEELSMAARSGKLQIALGAIDLPEQVRAARMPAAVVD